MTQSAKILCAAIGAAAVAATSLPADAALTVREESIVPIAAFTANGNEAALKSALETGLKNGITVTKIRSVLEQMYAYTGFPRSLTGLGVFVNLLKEHKAKGVEDVTGREAKPLPPAPATPDFGTTAHFPAGFGPGSEIRGFVSSLRERTIEEILSAPSKQKNSLKFEWENFPTLTSEKISHSSRRAPPPAFDAAHQTERGPERTPSLF